MSRYKHVVFDVDGTLMDTERAIREGCVIFLREHGLPADEEKIARAFGKTPLEAFTELGAAHLFQEMNDFVNAYMYSEGRSQLYPTVVELLTQLQERGVELAVCTSRGKHEFLLDTEFPKIEHFFRIVMTNDYAERPKPAPDPLLKYMKENGCSPTELLYIGDSVSDAGCALGAGVDFALALWGSNNPELAATYRLEKPMEILSLI